MPEIFFTDVSIFRLLPIPPPLPLRESQDPWIRRNWEERERERRQVRSAGTYHLNWPKSGIQGGINAIKPDYTVPSQGGEGCVSFEKP